ncbi:hypothetical protein D9M68_824810 [compost metagenome]
MDSKGSDDTSVTGVSAAIVSRSTRDAQWLSTSSCGNEARSSSANSGSRSKTTKRPCAARAGASARVMAPVPAPTSISTPGSLRSTSSRMARARALDAGAMAPMRRG